MEEMIQTVESHAKVEHEVHLTIRVLNQGSKIFNFKIGGDATLLNVLQKGAALAEVNLLPTPDSPLDVLHNILKHDEVGPALPDLSESIAEFLRRPKTSHDFGIELVFAFRVNTRWAVAPKPELSPREILALPQINLDVSQYSLYLANSIDLLPVDVPIKIKRGMAFEAQRDGKYGA